MPAVTVPFAPHKDRLPVTKENLEWAEIPIIDISKARTPQGRVELAPQMRNAMRTYGFMYVVNHGYTQAQNDRLFDIVDVTFSQVSEEEKARFSTSIRESGSYRGYKLRRQWAINGVLDEMEQYQFNEQDHHPAAIHPFLPEVAEFAAHNAHNIVDPILRCLAIGMELPEETFLKIHNLEKEYSFVGFMRYHPRSTEEDEDKSNGVWVKGHTDIGTISVLWSQPISGLQIMTPERNWRWVKHIDNALVINLGDAMEMLTGGFYKATIHRVAQPPIDQRDHARDGAYYFTMCDDDTKLVPFTESPALQREGIKRKIDDEHAPTLGQWRRGIMSTYGYTELKKKDDVVEQEMIEGVLVNYYN